jgi:hypothetical protein
MATVEEKLDFLLKEMKAVQANQLKVTSAVGDLTSWSKGADTLATELHNDISRGQPPGSPENPGESCLKPAKNKTKHTSNLNMHARHGPRRGGPHGPPERPNKAPPRTRSASLEGSRPPRAGSASLEAHAPPSGFRPARGSPPPSSGFRLARGSLTGAPAPAHRYEYLML